MSLGKLIKEALKLCEGIVEAEEVLVDLGIRGSQCHEPVDWLRWVIDPGKDSSVKDMCDACGSTEATKLIRDQLFLPQVKKLRDLLSMEVGTTVKSKRQKRVTAK